MVQNVQLNFHLKFCLPISALCTSFPRRMTKLAMEVLKCSSLFKDILPRGGSPDIGGRTCQSIPTTRKKQEILEMALHKMRKCLVYFT
jgi:hypothetical protein